MDFRLSRDKDKEELIALEEDDELKHSSGDDKEELVSILRRRPKSEAINELRILRRNQENQTGDSDEPTGMDSQRTLLDSYVERNNVTGQINLKSLDKDGFLYKKQNATGNWSKYFFHFVPEELELRYYKTKEVLFALYLH